VVPRHPAMRITAGARNSVWKKSKRAARARWPDDHTVSWDGNRWGCPGKKSARASWSASGNRTAAGWLALAAFPRALSAPAPLPGRGAIGKSFRPTACRTCRSKDENLPTQSKPKYHVPAHHLGENHGSGHFYLAETRTFLLCVDTKTDCLRDNVGAAGETETQRRIMSECSQWSR